MKRSLYRVRSRLVAVSVILWAAPLLAAGEQKDAATLLESTGIRGGLCLVVGARGPALAESLAERSTLYVQVVEPDAEKALAWGKRFAAGKFREQLGVRDAAFDADDYDWKLFNLLVVETPAALGKATMKDLFRILVPRGVVVFRAAPAGFADAAEGLGMAPVEAGGFAAGFRKPVRPPVEWKLPLALKWRAEPRTQISSGFAGIAAGGGKLFYMERMELDTGDLNRSGALIFARDAYNGRTIWTRYAPGGFSRYNGIAATSKGRLFVKTAGRKVLRLDGATGAVVSEVVPKTGRFTRIGLLNDDLLYVGGDVYSTKTGKRLWRFPRLRWQPMRGTIIGENIYFSDGKTLDARKLADGSPLWKRALRLPKPTSRSGNSAQMKQVGDYLLVRMQGKSKAECPFAVLDPADGKVLWTYTWNVRIGKERYFGARNVRFVAVDNKLIIYYRHNQSNSYADEVVVTRLDLATGKEEIKDRVLTPAGDFHGCFGELQLGRYRAYYDLWIDLKELKTIPVHMPHPACFFGSKAAYGLVYDFPSRKSGPVTAVGVADQVFKTEPGGRVLQTFGRPTSSDPVEAGGWPMFRGATAGGNFSPADFGTEWTKAWEAQVGLGGKDFGIMASRRTGLTQAVIGYGLAVVGDIDGQRIVALDVKSGETRWIFPVGSRVDYPPTLYKGRCLFAARDGWVRCLDVKTGSLLWKLRVPARERYIGGREKLESMWPLTSDVLIVKGIGYVAGGTPGGPAFHPETGKAVSAGHPAAIALGRRRLPGGRELVFSDDVVVKGNSIPRTNEDNWGGFRMQRFKRRLDARVLAFDDRLAVAFKFYPAGEGWANKGTLKLFAVTSNPRKPIWSSPPIELVVDDIVLTPKHVYCVGHYQRARKGPELWVLSRKDGKVLKTLPVDGFPAFLGLSAAGKRLFIATREGKLICLVGR